MYFHISFLFSLLYSSVYHAFDVIFYLHNNNDNNNNNNSSRCCPGPLAHDSGLPSAPRIQHSISVPANVTGLFKFRLSYWFGCYVEAADKNTDRCMNHLPFLLSRRPTVLEFNRVRTIV